MSVDNLLNQTISGGSNGQTTVSVTSVAVPVQKVEDNANPVEVTPESLPRIDAVSVTKSEPEISPENLPMKSADPEPEVGDDGMLPGFNSMDEKVAVPVPIAESENALDTDLPPEVETRNNPVFIDAVPPEREDAAKTAPKVEKAPLVFTEESPVPTRNGEPVPDYRTRLRQETDNVRKKSFRPMRMSEISSSDSIGVIMAKARRASGYSLDEVKLLTRIAEPYIVEIENDDTEKIPAVYCNAYIMALCNAYRLDAQVTDFVADLNRKLQSEREQIPVELMQEINRNVRVNEEEERRLNHIFTGILIGIGVLLIFGLWAIVVMVLKHKSSTEKKETVVAEQVEQKKTETSGDVPTTSTNKLNFDESKLKNLMPHPTYEFHTLEMSDKPGVNRDNGVR